MLIFPNGTLEFATMPHAVIDKNGNPIAETSTDSECRCTIETITENRNGRNDAGQYMNASYSVLLDEDSVEDDFNPSLVTLIHDDKGNLGQFKVQRIEHYHLTRSIQLWL